ncbi:MAG: NAD-dependent epimerase/dehydratase family protein [Proteobacteria bacterium]|nr:NAD-dependent epimerase/dehydratase family protein [Pseudomonadota bacterium]
MLPSYIIESILILNTLRNYNIKIIALVRNKEKSNRRFFRYLNRKDLVIIEKDVCESYEITEKIDYVIHAASNADPQSFLKDPLGTIKSNTIGTINLLEVAKKYNSRCFFYFSSGEVYGNVFDKNAYKIKENEYGIVDHTNIRNCYAEAKRMGEAICLSYHYQFKIPVSIVRPSHTYGPGIDLNDSRAFASFVNNVIQEKNIILNSDGSAKRSYLYLKDATLAYFTIILKGNKFGIYNVGNEYEISILDLANTIIKASGKRGLKVEYSKDCKKNSSPSRNGLLCIDNLKSLGWKPTTTELEGFKRTINFLNE